MASIVKTTFQLKRGMAATWIKLNPILAVGEPGYEIDTGALKIGNGKDHWLDLPYLSISESGEILASVQKDIIDIKKQLGGEESTEDSITARLARIEQDYLTSKHLEEIETLVTTVSSEAAQKAIDRILGEKVNADFDTLQEVAEWIAADTTNSAALINRLTAIEKKVETLTPGNVPTNTQDYEIFSRPAGSMVDYRDKEIRLFCAENTQWEFQTSGENADPNSYYVGFKAYAPSDDVVSFKEDLGEVITDPTMHSFENNKFAGIDEFGRKYSIVWLPVAAYDGSTGSWKYWGANSKTSKYIGWYYTVEWYNAAGQKVDTDSIRINLTNEKCHNNIEPYYMGSIDISRLVQGEDDVLILNGGEID